MSSESSSNRRQLYAEIEPYDEGFLPVDDIHTIFYEQCGNPDGMPAVVVHGGPGGGISAYYRRFFNPQHYRIVLFDQRGAGKSTPAAELKQNTTWHLVEDMEKLRKHLDIGSWLIFGGSWGSTLCLSYALRHKEVVKGLVLRGIFTLRHSELQFFYQDGASHLFPEAFEAYSSQVPAAERHDLIGAYYRRLTGDDKEETLRCARAWSVYEMSTSRLYVDPSYIARAANDDVFALAFARIEAHYFVNAGFFESDGYLIDHVHQLNGLPGVIIQGRYDVVCPCRTAWQLHKRWSSSRLHIVPDAGHSAKEAGIIHQLVGATDQFYKSLDFEAIS